MDRGPLIHRLQVYLGESVLEVVLQSQLPQKFVDLFFTITSMLHKLTNLCGNRLLQNDFKNTIFEMKV